MKMGGLRSTCRRELKAWVFFCLFLSLAFVLPGEEPSTEQAVTNEDSPLIPSTEQEITTDPLVDDMRRKITEEAPGELVNLHLGDSSVSLRIAGRWKGTLQASWGVALTPLGTTAISDDTPIFTQEGDITLSLWIRDRWFVEAGFMDDSALNTYRAGYQGREGEVIRYVGVGNTGLDFPAFPYLDLGGDSPSSFGAYGHFDAGNLSIHSLVRYDAAAREERVFVGDRERTFGYADLSRPQRGISFVLPDYNLSSVPEVYIQDNKGNILDSDGRRWRLAEPSEYGASAWEGLVELTLGTYTAGVTEPEGMVAVYYPGPYSLGTYDTPGSFLAEVQDYFDPDFANPLTAKIRLWDYPQPGQRGSIVLGTSNNVPGTVSINGNIALVIYEPGTFSPFEKQNRYLAPVNTSSSAALVKISTGETVPRYDVIPFEYNSLDTLINNPAFSSGAAGQDPYWGQRIIRRGVYELIQEGGRKHRSAQERWPLADSSRSDSYPELYLPGRLVFTEDIGLRFTNYSAAGAFSIGTDVVPGSVQVYRNGIQDPNFSYNPSGGTVSLLNPAGFSEVIRITYLKQSSERRLGSLAAGIGAIWDPEGPFSGKLGLGLRWNVTSEAYSEDGATSPGTVGLGAEAKWDYDRLKTGLTLGLGFEQPDTTGLYRVTGMEGNELILPLPPATSFISEAPVSFAINERADLSYRNYRETSILGNTSLADVSSSAPLVSGQTGPYPAMDGALSSQVLVAEFEFTSGKNWTGFEVPLDANGVFLEQAGKIEVPFRFMNFSPSPSGGNIMVKLQIGALADKDSGYPENPELIVDDLILYDDATADRSDRSRIAAFTLSDRQREKLQGAKYMRLLIYRGYSLENFSGRVILAPPIVRGTLWRPVTVTGNEINSTKTMGSPQVNVVEEIEFGYNKLEDKYSDIMKQLHSGSSRQRIMEISWKDFSAADSGPGADGRIPAIPLSSYRSLSFFVRRPRSDSDQTTLNAATLRFIIARGPSSLNRRDAEIALEASIPLEAFSSVSPGEWTRVDIQYRGGKEKVLVDGKAAPGSSVTYRNSAAAGSGSGNPGQSSVQEQGNSSYAAVFLVPGGAALPDGDMAIDEIFMEEPVPSYRLNNGASVEWTLPGTILQIRDTSVISDISMQAALETGAQGNPFEEGNDGSFGMNGRSRAELSLLGLRVSGNYSYSMNTSQATGTGYTWSAGHGLFRSFGPFSIRESFDDAPADRTMNHRLGFALDTRVRGSLSGEVIYEDEKLRRRWQAGTGGKPAERVPVDFSLDAQAGTSEKTKAGSEGPELSNYAGAWLDSFGDMAPDSGSSAENRDLRGSFRVRLDTFPLGTELFFQGTTSYSKPMETSQSASLARLDFPVKPEGSNFRMLFRTEREYRRELSDESFDFADDSKIWAQSFGDALPMVFSLPFYSLFTSRMEDRMDEFSSTGNPAGNPAASKVNSSQFADRFEYSLQTTGNYGLSSLFLPNRFSFRLSRILERRLDIPRDTLNLGAGVGFSSVNMFGAMGIKPVFNFYQGDEFSQTVETLFAFPKGETVAWSVRAGQDASFYGFYGAELSFSNTLAVNSSTRIGEGSRWTDSLVAAWTVPSEKTLLGTIYAAFTRMAGRQKSWLTLVNLAESEYELLRKETLEFVFERIPDAFEGDYSRFSLILGHESIVRIFGHLNLSVFTKLTIAEDFNTKILSFMGTIGTTLHLMF